MSISIVRGILLSSVVWPSLSLATTLGADLKPGDTLANCSKIPLVPISAEYQPQNYGGSGLEQLLLSDGVVIVHFCSPRPKRQEPFSTTFVKDLSDLRKAAQSVPYPCKAVAVVPLGSKGREDAQTVLEASEEKPWGDTPVLFEPTYPRPGLYRTFRPDADDVDVANVTTPWTFLVGPGRKILAVRDPSNSDSLYDWLQKNLPEKVVAVPKEPSSNLSLPDNDPWVWPTFRRTAQHAPIASNLPDILPYTYLAWQQRIGRTFASPAVADNVVYVNTDDRGLQSLALSTGQVVASFPMGPSWWTSPVVAGPFAFTVSADGTVFAIERSTFREKWRKNLGALVTSSPMVGNGALYIGSRNGRVYAIDVSNGEVLWQFQTGGEISSSPSLVNGVVVIGSGDRNVYAIDAKTGTQKWAAPTGGPVDSSPTVAGGNILVGSFDGALYSFKLDTGQLNWRCPLGGWVHSSPAVSDETVFVGTVNFPRDTVPTFNWVQLGTGKVLGSFEMPDGIYSSPTVWGDLVLVGSRDRQLYAFDRKMRQTQPAWTYRTRSYVHASPVVVGDTVLVASFDGDLYALRQAKPIRVWKDGDVVPRWFVAAVSKELHTAVSALVSKAASGKVGEEMRLRKFDDVFDSIRSGAAKTGTPPKVLPSDVPAEHPGAGYVEYVLTSGLLTGYPDSTFRPNEPTTRYQFSFGISTVLQAILRPDFAWKALGANTKQGAQVEVRVRPAPGRPRTMPQDVPGNHWAFKAISDLAADGLVPLDDDGNYRGGRTLTLKDARDHWDLYAAAIVVVRTK